MAHSRRRAPGRYTRILRDCEYARSRVVFRTYISSLIHVFIQSPTRLAQGGPAYM
jgi:hypothetical protein